MAKMFSDGNHRLLWVPTIVDVTKPKITEITAPGVLNIGPIVLQQNMTLGVTGEEAINDPVLTSRSNDTIPGRITRQAEMDFLRFTDPVEDVAYTTFNAKGVSGHLVRRIGKANEAPLAAGDVVLCWRVVTGTPMDPSFATGLQKFRVVFYPDGAACSERAVVTA